jgi:signal recognition particle subunit SRP54
VNLARSFDQRVDITGIVLTRVDGDGRGGAALSMRAVTGKPIKLMATGEKLDALEDFHPSRIADRILGMGDIVGLVERAAQNVNAEDAAKMAKKLKKGSFDLEDLRGQLQQMKKMGGMGALMGMMPGMGQMKKALAGANLDEKVFDRQIAVINSMTKAERANPDLLNAKRRIRIANGSGTKVEDVNKVVKQHRQMADMMKKVSKGGMGSLAGMFGGKMGGMMPGLGNMDPSKMDPAQLEAMAKQMGMDPKAIAGAAQAAAPKDISTKLPSDVGQLLKSGSGMPGLGGASRFPGLPGLGGGFVPKKK